ncbi:MAG: DUF2339 domain-containing protein [Holophagaceae bacterium]|nr:DUF2339 domain-containing protein [Holophagaceae bacterium]
MEKNRTSNIRNALNNLHESHFAVDEAFRAFIEQDISKENESLLQAVEGLKQQLQTSREETAKFRREYEEIKKNFKHELSSKRIALLGLSERKYETYLATSLESEQTRLSGLYSDLQRTVESMSAELQTLDLEEREPLYAELVTLRERVGSQIKQAKERKDATWRNVADYGAFDEIKNSPIEDVALGAVRFFFAWETFLGLKIISVVGALMLLFGVFTSGRYLYVGMSPGARCFLFFLFGLALMGEGEILHRGKWRGAFSQALTAAGSGILFLGAALGYMTLGVLPIWVAFSICMGVSYITFAASIRYNSQLIAVFALIGGYLPLLAIKSSITLFGSIYFTILTLLALMIATRKNWRMARFIGLFAGLLAELVLLASLGRTTSGETIFAVGATIAIGYVAYLIIPVFGAWFTKTHIRSADIFLLTCNMFFRFLLLLSWGGAFVRWGWHGHQDAMSAIVAIFFAIPCVAMALSVERQKHSGVPESETGSLRALFFITSFTYSTLAVLFALDRAWFSIGWLAEATGLALYGTYKNRRRFCIAGLIIGILCLWVFLTVNVPNYKHDPLFVWKYLSFTVATIAVSVASLKYAPERTNNRRWLDIFRFFVALNFWGYIVYVLRSPLLPTLKQWLGFSATGFASLLSITIGLLIAFMLPRIRRISNQGFQVAAITIGIFCTLWLMSFNGRAGVITEGQLAISIVAFALYIVVNIIAIGWIGDLLRLLIAARKLPLGWYPLLISGFAMLLTAQTLVVQLSLKSSSLILTLLFGVTALGWVINGFVKRNAVTRIGGLAMAFFAIIKLFLLDLHGLGTVGKIVSYFTAGILLLAISFTYQWFSKRLEQMTIADEEMPTEGEQ